MRTDARRTAKYDAKIGMEILPQQNANFEARIKRQVEIEEIVNSVVGPDINRVYYIIFGKEVWKKMQQHKQETLDTEVHILEDKWIKRGLNMAMLDEIENRLGYAITFKFFVIDSSLLDGDDRLA